MKRSEEQNKTSRQLQAEQTKHRIYNTARELITNEGYDKVTVDEICRTAGISKGLFYHYFSSKDEIIVIEGYTECDEYFKNNVQGKLKEENRLERIVEYIDHQILYADNIGVELITQVYKSQIQSGNTFFTSECRILPSILREIISEGQQRGEITGNPDADYITNYILRFSRGLIYDWCVHNGSYDLKETSHEAVVRLVELFKAT